MRFLPGFVGVGATALSVLAPASAAQATMGALVSAAPLQDSTVGLQVTFLDVGQADAVLLQAPEGQTVLVDAGRRSPTEVLRERGVEEIDLLVATHAHSDHIGGMAAVIREFPVRAFLDNGMPHSTRTYERLMEEVERRSEITYLAPTPRTISLGSVSVQVLPMPPPGRNQNNRSVTLVVRHGRFTAFLSGDSEVRQLSFLVGQEVVPPVTLLKAPHHGSDNGFTPAFLQLARPKVVVISVGRNSYGHPRPEALAAFSQIADQVLRTDRDGAVTVVGFPDGQYQVILGDAEGDDPPHYQLPERGARRSPGGGRR